MFFIFIRAKIYDMKIKEILEFGRNNLIKKEDSLRISKMLLRYVLNVDNSYLLINSEKQLSLEIEKIFKEGIKLLNQGTPLQYITNNQEFMKLNFYVDSNVLIPQPDTEILVEEVLNVINKGEVKNILDLCTGSGAIGVSIAKYTEAVITMSDISKNALEIAKKNAVNNEVVSKCNFILSNMFENIKETFDIIVSNPPYIKTKIITTLDKEVQNEPIIALDGGIDGLDFYKVIAENSYQYLNENGILALEIGYDQKEDVIALLNSTGHYKNIYAKRDLAGNNRIIIANI